MDGIARSDRDAARRESHRRGRTPNWWDLQKRGYLISFEKAIEATKPLLDRLTVEAVVHAETFESGNLTYVRANPFDRHDKDSATSWSDRSAVNARTGVSAGWVWIASIVASGMRWPACAGSHNRGMASEIFISTSF